LNSGDRVETAAASNATLEFADGSRFQLRQNSLLELDTLSTYGDTGMVDTRMRLQRGRINGQVRPGSGADTRYQIETPAAVAAVRGTDYRLNADAGGGALRAEVLDGRVSITGAGRTRQLAPGQGTLTEAGSPPRPPRALLPAPVVNAIARRIERIPIVLTWEPVAGAVSYRVQLASDQRFDDLLFEEVSSSAQIRGPSPADGEYFLRIRAIDELALEGLDVTVPVTLAARPEPPFLIAPRAEEVVLAANPAFEWSQAEQASAYRFQLADSADFSNLLVDLNGYSGSRLVVDSELAEGGYFWRVATLADAKQGPYSDPQLFQLRPSPAPELALDENDMTIQWPAGLAGERFHFQLARDDQFSQILEDRTLDQPSLTLARPAPGSYYTRVASINAGGLEGGFGATQRIDVPNDSPWPYVILSTLVLLLAL
jgi:hypothetical protein